MKRLLAKWNTLRNQMLIGFLLAMMIILTVVGGITFDSVSTLLKNNAEKHIQQTAVQASGRIEGILSQIDSLTTEAATNPYVQSLLLKEAGGSAASFSERQSLSAVVGNVQVYGSGVESVELYGADRQRLFPLDEASLLDKVSGEWVARALEAKGSMIWYGLDPEDPESLLAMRRVSLMERNFQAGGYLLVQVSRSVFEFKDPLTGDGEPETMLLLAENGSLIASNDPGMTESEALRLSAADRQTVTAGGRTYILVRQRSEMTGWTLLILTPVHAITEGISVLRTAILVSAGIGTLLFMLLSFLLSTIITRPVFRLIKTMRGARLGVLRRADIVSSTLEINELGHAYNRMVDHINGLIRIVYEKELLQSRTELQALQAQIHPHFLFNTLEALYWSLQEKEEEELAEFVVAMSDLFRYTITGPNKDEWVTLREELDHIERYLLIMKMRFEDRLTWSIDAPPAYDGARLPKLLLQPLVENAILHGVESRIGPGTVTVSVVRAEEELAISVEDDGEGMDEETLRLLFASPESRRPSAKKSGVGIANVRQRLRLYFAEPQEGLERFAIRSRKGEGTRVTVTIPLTTRQPVHRPSADDTGFREEREP
ncbi:cache domain-containing sensor histidine kinase [Cohnella zeiphila]|uniref:histidine kinase n=1 Tax=Cohnella zeiphila TaxID=2761120 RepID=A0A7X0SHE4_9BACL|nr:sensor histidine kinase [Cohnella zeiphila]MBB6730025.1 sensor histidine kinase [Cohnella zeiphila]